MTESGIETLDTAVAAWMDFTSRNCTSREVVLGIPRAVILRDEQTGEARRIRFGALFSQVLPAARGAEPLSGMGLVNQVRANFDWHSAEPTAWEGISPFERLVAAALPPRGILMSEDGVDGIQGALSTLLKTSSEAEDEPDFSEKTFGVRGEEFAGAETEGLPA